MDPTARIPHLPALDGLRALAVLAVLFYHADSRLLPGGFLGVEIFFVISGWLITSLLIAERDATGRVDLKQFWLRRARRLLPALATLLVVVCSIAAFILPDEATKIRADAVSAIAYFNNWSQIFSHTSYFESSGRPSLLKHLWSLSVEEQFYIVWPLLFLAFVSCARKTGIVFVLLLAAAASTLTMAALFNPDADPTRVYFGTDTRASGMLIGAALAFVVRPRKASSRLTDIPAMGALVALVTACFAFTEFSPLLYRGGFALVALATALLITALASGARTTTALLSIAPMRWLGERSYGIYLWHFPVFMLTRPQLDLALDGLPLLALRFVVILVIAEISFRLVEAPIRRGALETAWRAWREARGTARLAWTMRWATAGFASAIIVSTLGVALLLARPVQPAREAGVRSDLTLEVAQTSSAQLAVDVSSPPAPVEIPDLPPAPIFPDSRAVTNTVVVAPKPATILAIGDSVMEGVTNELIHAFGSNIVLDAKQGRQPSAVLNIVRDFRAAGRSADTVVIHVGNNGIFREATFEKIFAELTGAKRVLVVNCKVPRAWEQPNNEMLAAAAQRHPNVVLLDWHGLTGTRPEIFWKDGIHVKPTGAQLYASLVTEAVRPSAQLAMGPR